MPIPSRLPSHQFLIPDGKYADLEVTCGTGIVKVHKVVVCGMSPVLDNITKPGTKGKKSQLPIYGHEWDTVARAFFWMYYGGYRTPSEKYQQRLSTTASSEATKTSTELTLADMKLHFSILKFAKEYKIEQLQKEAKQRILDIIQGTCETSIIVEYIRRVHSGASDDALLSLAATQVADRYDDLVNDPAFATLWLPGPFYTRLLRSLSPKQTSNLCPVTPYKRKSTEPLVAPLKRGHTGSKLCQPPSTQK